MNTMPKTTPQQPSTKRGTTSGVGSSLEGIRMKVPRKLLSITFVIFIILLASQTFHSYAANIYVDNTLGANCTTDNYSIANRLCNGSAGKAYTTIQSAINAVTVGDIIYMRGGTYMEIGIDIPESKNGTSWVSGNYTTLTSYPNEWAMINGTGLNTSSNWPMQAVITHPTEYGVELSSEYTKYWKFEKFEVTGGRTGFFLKGGPMWFRYLYIHDNGRDFGDQLQAGILIPIGRDNIIEYNWIKDNIAPVGSSSRDANNSNILIDADYRDTTDNNGNGLTFDPQACIKNNEIRYNLIDGSFRGIRHKNQQRFGYNNRNPQDMTYKDWGDKIHHNIVQNVLSASIVTGQDFVQVYNNISDNIISTTQDGDVPTTYNATIYNNTVLGTKGFLLSSGLSEYGNSRLNYYDNGGQQIVHPHVWFYNNISGGTGSGWHEIPFVLAWDMPANTSNPSQDWSDLVVERNLIHQASQTSTFLVGHQATGYSGCEYQNKTTAEFNICSATWRGVQSVINWENTDAGLFVGVAGSGKYITNGNYFLSTSKTISNGGIGGPHPYLPFMLPNYVGATNPKDNAWVAGVLSLSNVNMLKNATGNPSWTTDSTVPGKIQGLTIQ